MNHISKKDDFISDIERAVKKYKKPEQPTEQESMQTITKKDIESLIASLNRQQPQNIYEQPRKLQPQQIKQQKQPIDKNQIAYQLWKDSKAMLIVCLIAIILPMATVLITMFPDGEMFALIIAFIGIIYPIIIFAKMMSMQSRLKQKYGLKPLLEFQPQQMPTQMKQQNPYEEML